eukprot:sb/3472834/
MVTTLVTMSQNVYTFTISRNRPIRTRYLGHVNGYQPIRDQYSLIRSVPDYLFLAGVYQEPTESSNQSIRTRYLDHVTCYQPIRDPYFLIRSVPGCPNSPINNLNPSHDGFCRVWDLDKLRWQQEPTDPSKHPRTRYLGHWLSANQGPVFPDSVGSWLTVI